MRTCGHPNARAIIGLLLIAFCAAGMNSLCIAQDAAAAPELPNEEAAGTFASTEELESFFDGVFSAQKDIYKLAGLTVSVVHNGEIVFA